MKPENQRTRLEIKAVIVGYAMSRLDVKYLDAFGFRSWKSAFSTIGDQLGIASASLKNLRDEFDPFHSNPRRGWHKRPLRRNRQRVLGELCDVSDDALVELVRGIVLGDGTTTDIAVDALVLPVRTVQNVAERLLTGRRAEELFLKNCERLLRIPPDQLIDLRNAAAGYDFGVKTQPSAAIEVKGLKEKSGSVLFTDKEWSEALSRRDDYRLVVVGNLAATPVFGVWANPAEAFAARCRYQTTIAAQWTFSVSIG